MGINADKLAKKLITTLFIVILLIVLGTFATGYITNKMIKTIEIRQGTIQDVIPLEAYVIRNEKVLVAPQSGELKESVAEGERVRLGSVIAEVITPSLETLSGQVGSKIKANGTGLVSYEIDGLEGLVTLENLEKINPRDILEYKLQARSTKVEKGKPVVKIVDNLGAFHLYIQLAAEELESEIFQEGKNVKINLLEDSRKKGEIKGKVVSIKKHGDYGQAIIKSQEFNKVFLENRLIELEIVKEDFQGYIIPEDAIVEKDGKTGIFIVYKKTARWIEVEVVGIIEDQVAVTGTRLNSNTVVITNPSLVKEGRRLN